MNDDENIDLEEDDAFESDIEIQAGIPLKPGSPLAEHDVVIERLRTVFDPEIPVNIYDLGLIYDVSCIENGDVNIVMTLTTPACPVAETMPGQVARTVALEETVGMVSVTLTWSPQWTTEKMSEDAKLALDFF